MSECSSLGATYLGDGQCDFCVWAPLVERVEVHSLGRHGRIQPLNSRPDGYHTGTLGGIYPGDGYLYRLDGDRERPDPASRYQPEGVHGHSALVDTAAFEWSDGGWFGLPLERYVIYEIHVGTFSPAGTLDAIIPHLDEIRELGITALELMPVAQFPGSRNWGYDGVHPFAVQNSYGGPAALQRLVDACHQRGLAVILDAVYNHLGPEGNYLADFGPYFTDRYRTPWGWAMNFDGPASDEVRRFFVENALYWVTDLHVDALRLDAVHAIMDLSAQPFLADLAEAVYHRATELNRRIHLIAESDLNDARIILPTDRGGCGMDAQWSDDFHHALHVLLTGERNGYYEDFAGVESLAQVLRNGYAYSGQYSSYRRRRHGNSARMNPARQFVVCSQNHDQVGNRMLGDRLTQMVDFDALKLAAGTVLLSPFVPLLFMGEEYGEIAPFQYFTSHQDGALVEAVRKGRREEFADFKWQGEVPDPQDEATFLRSRLNHGLRIRDHHRVLWDLYHELIRLRRVTPALAHLSKEHLEVVPLGRSRVVSLRRWSDRSETLLLLNFGHAEAPVTVPAAAGRYHKRLDSSEERWLGSGSTIPGLLDSEGEVSLSLPPRMFALFVRNE